jgi:hypothetical protein
MSVSRTVKIAVALLLAFGFAKASDLMSPSGEQGLITEAHAVVGRPLTPVSVAGVARRTTRRTVRRCAAGIYYC